MHQLCVTVSAPTMAELRRRRDAVADADLVELRLDSVVDADVAGALAGRRRPAIVTCRPLWEGGSFAGPEADRKRLLRDALTGGAEFVDIEARAGFDDLITADTRGRVVLSSHDFGGVPADLDSRIRSMLATGAGTVKLAVQTSRLTDCVTLVDAAKRWHDAATPQRLVLIGMGEHGVITRVLPSRFHSRWSYAGALESLGQLTPDTLLNEYRFRDRGPGTALYGITGAPVSHSVSPPMHNAAFRAAGIDAVYLPLPAADPHDFMTFAQAFTLRGASVTIPYKVGIAARVDEMSALAEKIGAVNAVRRDGSRWLGDNTDAEGFLEPLRDRMPLTGMRAALLGAGGAARGVAVALAASGAVVTVHARQPERAKDVAALVSGSVGPWPPQRGAWDLLVNCTPLGMHPRVGETPLAQEFLMPGAIVYDLVYNPQTTRLLMEAEHAGCRTIGGLDMLVGQARQAFRWWTGVPASGPVMRAAAVDRLMQFTTGVNPAAAAPSAATVTGGGDR